MKFDPRYTQAMLENLVATRGWSKVAKLTPLDDNSSEGDCIMEWIDNYCKGDVQSHSEYLYFSKPEEATAFVMKWAR
jgi:hypothetical protein